MRQEHFKNLVLLLWKVTTKGPEINLLFGLLAGSSINSGVNCSLMLLPATLKKIGYTQAFKAITAGLIIAYVIMALMAGPFWLFYFDYTPTILFAVIISYIAGYFFGGLTSTWILKHKQPAILFGIIGGLLIVWSATFTGSLVGLIKEGLPNQSEISEPFHDYVFKPMVIVTLYGFFPILLVGIWFGLSIKRQGSKIKNAGTQIT